MKQVNVTLKITFNTEAYASGDFGMLECLVEISPTNLYSSGVDYSAKEIKSNSA